MAFNIDLNLEAVALRLRREIFSLMAAMRPHGRWLQHVLDVTRTGWCKSTEMPMSWLGGPGCLIDAAAPSTAYRRTSWPAVLR
nr:hypothetical protein [Mycobacterium sp. TKK-01-0059]